MGCPKVSIIMGIFNCQYIARLKTSIASIINQSFQDWEFIIVDDGSDDSGTTFNTLLDISLTDERIIPLRYENNRGLAYALNFGLRHATGRYIARQDDDDVSEPSRLSRQIAFLDSHPKYDILGTNARLFDAEGEWGNLIMPEVPTREDFLWNSPFIHPSVVMRASALRAVGGYRVASETSRGQDYDLFMRMYARGSLGFNLQDSLYQYRSERSVSKYHPMSQRINEARVRASGFKALGLDGRRYLYIIKPIILGIVPKRGYGTVQKYRTKK